MTAIHEKKVHSLNSIHISLVLDRSAHLKCGIEGLKKSRVAERFEQALHGTLFEQACTEGLICLSSDEDDRDLLPANRQLLLQIGSGHAGHGDVEDQTFRLADENGRTK
jgi:hypothetical protein